MEETSIILRDANDTLYLAVRTDKKTHGGAPLWTLAADEDREPAPANHEGGK